jgi:hypothetical protein
VVGALLGRGLVAERVSDSLQKAYPAMNTMAIGVEPAMVPHPFNESEPAAGAPSAAAGKPREGARCTPSTCRSCRRGG